MNANLLGFAVSSSSSRSFRSNNGLVVLLTTTSRTRHVVGCQPSGARLKTFLSLSYVVVCIERK